MADWIIYSRLKFMMSQKIAFLFADTKYRDTHWVWILYLGYSINREYVVVEDLYIPQEVYYIMIYSAP